MEIHTSNEELKCEIFKLTEIFLEDTPLSLALYSFITSKEFDVEFIDTNDKDYRGECNFNKITIFNSKYETVESLKWLFLHELGHLFLQHNEVTKALITFSKREHYRKIGFGSKDEMYYNCEGYYEYYCSDEGHEIDPEEKIVSDFATFIIGTDLSRSWWRDNIKKINNTETNTKLKNSEERLN